MSMYSNIEFKTFIHWLVRLELYMYITYKMGITQAVRKEIAIYYIKQQPFFKKTRGVNQ